MMLVKRALGLVLVLAVALPVLFFIVRRAPDNVRALFQA